MQRWQAIIFDMDDTLYPEEMYVLSGFRAVAQWGGAHLGVNETEGYSYLKELFFSGVRNDTFNRWLTHFELIEPSANTEQFAVAVAPLVAAYRKHQPVLMPFPEVPELLPQLTKRYRLGLVSDGYLAVQQRKWQALNLAAYFDAVVFSDQWGRDAWKPNTKPFQEVLRQLQVEPQQALYIGDNPKKDFLGARQLGMETIWLRQEGGQYTALQPPTDEHTPHQTVPSWQSLSAVLCSNPKIHHR